MYGHVRVIRFSLKYGLGICFDRHKWILIYKIGCVLFLKSLYVSVIIFLMRFEFIAVREHGWVEVVSR